MKTLLVRLLLLLSVLYCVPANALSRDPLLVDLPALEAPPGADWFWVGQHMAMNNIPMSVKLFTFRGEAESVEKYYLSKWRSLGHGKLTNKAIDTLKVLGYELDGFHYSVQFSEKAGVVEGKIVVTPTPLNYSADKRTTLPIAPRSKVSSKVESLDSGRRSETLTLDSSLGVRQLLDFYVVELQRDGWVRYSISGDLESGAVAGFQRSGELLQLTIKQLQGRNSSFSQVLLHWVK